MAKGKRRGGCMRAIGSVVNSLAILVVVTLGIAGITWASDGCTVFQQGSNLTMRGWGSTEACNGIVNSDVNQVAGVLHILSGGLISGAHEGAPTGATICSGWDGDIQYTIRDQGFTHLYILGHAWCHYMPNTKPFSNISQLVGVH